MNATIETNENDLIARCKTGDQGALQVLYNLHKQKIYAMAMRMTGSTADAEDVVQDTFIRAFRSISNFRADAQVSTWLCRIAINLTRDLYKKKQRLNPEVEIAARNYSNDPLAIKNLECALAQLPEGYREVLVMHDVIEMGHKEIAAVLSVKEGTSKSQLHKARARMRELLTVATGAQ